MQKTLLSFGHGYSASAIAAMLLPLGWRIYGTTRNPETCDRLQSQGVIPLLWETPEIDSVIATCDAVLTSIAPNDIGDPVLMRYGDQLAQNAQRYSWVGYLSTTGVYGDRNGDWVDETSSLDPATERGKRRVAAEASWRGIENLPLHIFRLAGIYGPSRGPFAKVRNGTAQRIIKPGQVFSRIHVDDIAQAVVASILHPNPGAVYNLCDDDPAPPQDVIAHAATLLGLPLPPEVAFDTAVLSPMARSFYSESKRVSNARMKNELGIQLKHPDYKSGLQHILETER